MSEFDLDFLDLDSAEARAKELAESQPEIEDGEAECDSCKI